MHFWTLAFLLGHLALVGAAPEEASTTTAVVVVEEETAPSYKMATSGKMAAGVKMTTSALHLLTSPCMAATTTTTKTTTTTTAASSSATLPTVPSTTQSTTQSTTTPSAAHPTPGTSQTSAPGTSQTSAAPIVLTGATQIAVGGPTRSHPVSVGSGAEILIVDSNGTAAPIVLEAGDEIIVGGSGGSGDASPRPQNPADGGGAEILIGSSEENATFATIVLSAGDQIVFATSDGARTETVSSIVLGNETEVKVAGAHTANAPIILSNGTEVLTDHYSDTDELDNIVVTTENGDSSTSTSTATTTINVTQGNITVLEVVSGAPEATTLLPNPMTIVISLDSSFYTWAPWSTWYCNCVNSSMSRVRGVVNKSTGATLQYNDYQPSHFQREPCNYKVCECSKEAKQCHATNVSCSESDPYDCVLSDINYQEIMDSKDYWKKLKKGAQALYLKIKTFLKQNAIEET